MRLLHLLLVDVVIGLHLSWNRFPEAIMMYDPVINHFVAQIDGRLYDISGEVTQKYKVVRWDTYPDELEKKRIIRDCVNF